MFKVSGFKFQGSLCLTMQTSCLQAKAIHETTRTGHETTRNEIPFRLVSFVLIRVSSWILLLWLRLLTRKKRAVISIAKEN
jgi:hypothetical protein